jgi:hypothetical protein
MTDMGIAGKSRRVSSAVTSGRRLFVEGGDGNSAWARRYRDLVRAHEQDLSGGADLSVAQISLIRRVATIEIELEQREGMLSKGEPVDLDGYTRAASHLRRILESLGLERRQRDVSPTLEEIAAEIEAEEEAAREAADAAQRDTEHEAAE